MVGQIAQPYWEIAHIYVEYEVFLPRTIDKGTVIYIDFITISVNFGVGQIRPINIVLLYFPTMVSSFGQQATFTRQLLCKPAARALA
jgi:hypothetical protein